MPSITKITEQRRRANRRNVFLDGTFAFGVNLNVIAKFRLREGMTLSDAQVLEIQRGEVRQECFDKAMQYLQMRLHSRAELGKKLMRREYGQAVVDGVLDDLVRLGYLNDEQFARTKALSASEHKHHGRRRVKIELLKSGIKGDIADRALDDVFAQTDSLANAKLLARKQGPRLRKLDPTVARRRLVGMLQRRGFDYETIKPVVDEVLGGRDADET
ncbi:MAG: regulatory protein RecX [Phycisphaerales bacterium]|nr:regulatory protein RecX [Phycisphaerales bacterium]